MVCTVVMRRYKIAEGEWNYDTSVSKAQAVKLTGSANVSGATILRGDTAIIFDRAMGGLYTKNPETPTPTPTPVPTTTPGATTAMTIEEMKAEIVRLTNVEREKAGLTPVEILPELMDCAQAKAQDMSDNSYFSHNSKKYGSADKMISSFVPKNNGTRENIAYTMDYYSAKNMFTAAWVASKEHYKNLTNPNMTHIGVGIADTNDDKRLWVMQLVAK
jgi:uncharacterized protein YkwD